MTLHKVHREQDSKAQSIALTAALNSIIIIIIIIIIKAVDRHRIKVTKPCNEKNQACNTRWPIANNLYRVFT